MSKRLWMFIGSLLLLASAVPVAQAQAERPAYVDGYVVDAVTGSQIAGAQVRITTGGDSLSLTTDDSGHFSGQIVIGGESQLADVTVTANGYGTWTMRNTPLFAGQVRLFPAIMLRAEAQTIDVDGLPTDEPPPPPEYLQGRDPSQPDRAPQFWSHDIIPSSIRVARSGHLHCGYWENGSYILYPIVTVETVNFRDYVKNVVPNEWISSWHPEALKAGAVAAKMYAWWKINIGPRGVFNGQEYDVRGDTCDQVYVPNSRVSTTDDAVDATWPYIMRLNGLVSRIHYTDRVSTCESAGLSPCMGQWDSQYMAQDGADWQTILMTFYQGFQITFSTDAIPPAPANTDLVRNGNFDLGFGYWSRSLNTDYGVYNNGEGNFLAWKGRSGNGGRISQLLNYRVPAGMPLELALELGNSSGAQKTVRVYLHRFTSAPDWTNAALCEFTLPPNTPMQSYVLRYKTMTVWENIAVWIEGYPADNLPDIFTDNVRLRLYPSLHLNAPQCAPAGVTGLYQTFWDFTGNGAPYGWYAGNDALVAPTRIQGGLRWQTNGGNPHLLGPSLVPFNAASYPYFYVKLASNANNCGRIYFMKSGQRTFRESQAVDFNINSDGLMRGYLVDMRANAEWSGTITRLRLDPTCDSVPVERHVTLERAMLWNNSTPPQPAGYITRITPAPDATLSDPNMPTVFQWQAEPNALWYHIVVNGSNGFKIDVWKSRDAVCAGQTCTLTDSQALSNGNYTWQMTGWGYAGPGSTSDSAFVVNVAPPGTITRSAPSDPLAAVFQWQRRSDTLWYHIVVNGPNGKLINQWHNAAAVCNETVCTHPGTYSLRNGTYNWWMAGWNPAGKGRYDNVSFSVNLPLPGNIQRTPPQTAIDAVLSWTTDPNATYYHFYLGRDGTAVVNEWFPASAVCVGNTCQLAPRTLTNGNYDWWMAAWGPGGKGPYDRVQFSINEPVPDAVSRISPQDGAVVAVGTFNLQWTSQPQAQWYRVLLKRPDGWAYSQWVKRDDVCAGDVCSYLVTLPAGTYEWWAAAWGPGGTGAYTRVTFNVQ